MLRGLYDFRPINEKTLGFGTGQLLLFLEPHGRDKNWLRVADAHGRIGFVPINFIEIHRETSSDMLISFLDESIRRAQRDGLSTVELLESLRVNLSRYSTEEHMSSIEKQLVDLRARAIAELNYDEDYCRRMAKSSEKQRAAQTTWSPQPRKSGGGSTKSSVPRGPCYMPGCGVEEEIAGSPLLILPGAERMNMKSKCQKKKHNKKQPQPGQSHTQYAEIQVIQPPSTEAFTPQRIVGVGEYVQADRKSKCDGGEVVAEKIDEPLCNIGHSSCSCSCCHDPPAQCARSASPIDTVTLAAEVVDIVRNVTGLSHKSSQDATEAVLQYIAEKISDSGMNSGVTKLLVHLESPRAVSQCPSVISRSPDAYNIRKIFNRLTECKDDEQQRSWALHEDEGMILDNLHALYTILRDADASITKYVLEWEGYKSVSALVLYYQMETRWSIRKELLRCFGLLCEIDHAALSVLLNSILPMELAREIREITQNIERLLICMELLVMLLSCGETIPITHHEHLTGEFLERILNIIEENEETLADEAMKILFAYNLQFSHGSDNPIVSTLESRPNASVFTQKLVYFLNREVDPVDLFEHGRQAPHSVLKMTTDIFNSKTAANLFYTNDIKVLIDIVTRCLTDLGPGDQRRTLYLRLIQVIIRNSNYDEHCHRAEDLRAAFSSILAEEDAAASTDQAIVRLLLAEFPATFH